MPSRNIIKHDLDETFYHVYSRGINKQAIFNDDNDYIFFLGLCKRYLSPEIAKDKRGLSYLNFNKTLELLAYCLMPNHIHLFLYQIEAKAMQQVMRAIMTSYSIYFNRKYNRRGPLFESRYKASNIDNDAYLQHISRYIHLNPRDWKNYKYSSLKYYIGTSSSQWIKPARVLDMLGQTETYVDFLADYEGQKEMLDELIHQLADV